MLKYVEKFVTWRHHVYILGYTPTLPTSWVYRNREPVAYSFALGSSRTIGLHRKFLQLQ